MIRRIMIGAAALLVVIALVLVAGYVWLDSRSGKSFVIAQIEAFEFDNGVRIGIGSISGSVYDKASFDDVTLIDTKGVFASAPSVEMVWRPFAFVNNRADISSITVPVATLNRIPFVKIVAPSDVPLFPDIDIDIAKASVDRLMVARAITGREHIVSLTGRARIADRRAQIFARGRADTAERFDLILDAVPDDDRFDLAFTFASPAGGLLPELAGVAEPVTASIRGKGDWTHWQGLATATVGNDQALRLGLAARSGRFALSGIARPGLVMADNNRALFEPATRIGAVASFNQRRAAINASLDSAAFGARASGVIDLGSNRFENMIVALAVPRPERLAPTLRGSGVRAALTLNDTFAAPRIGYRVTADRLAFGDIVLDQVSAAGNARGQSGAMRIPVRATAARISGIEAAAGGATGRVSLNGDLALANGRLVSDNLRLMSERINATAVIVADLNTGLYAGAFKGRVNDYLVQSVGNFSIDANASVKTSRTGFALIGTVKARSKRLINASVAEFLGGTTLVDADVRFDSDGVTRITRARVSAPAFRLTQGRGEYRQNGAIAFTGQGVSNQYGPLTLALSGTISKPIATIGAARPGFGLGLAGITATIRTNNRGFGVIARGTSDYGDFEGDLDILSGKGPLTLAINRANFAGITLAGRIQQSAAGPFTGRLSANGSGVDGVVSLGGVGKAQRVNLRATATNASFPGPAQLTVGRAIITADMILYDQPQIIADVQISEASTPTFAIFAGRAKLNYRGGRGSAQMLAEGRQSVPFRIAANADLTPALWRVATSGRANGIDFKTAAPAQIAISRSTYTLRPAKILLTGGTIDLAGTYGRGLSVQSRLSSFDLAILNPLYPGIGLGGTVTGSVDFAQATTSAFPTADARLTISNFTRTSLAAISPPVDMTIVGRLVPSGGNLRSLVTKRGAVIGRLRADLLPLPPGSGSWWTRLMAAPLSGGIRYNGPADILFSLAGLPDQSLTGPLGLAADVSGRVQSPQLNGVMRANALVYENQAYGTKLTQMKLRGTFVNDRLDVTELTAKAGDGTLSGKGFVSLSSAKGFPAQLDLEMQNARLANGDGLVASATGALKLVNAPGMPAVVTGTLSLPETRYKIVRQGAAKVATLTGIRRKPPLGRPAFAANPDPISSLPGEIRLDIKLVAQNQIYVSGMGLSSEWSATLGITGTSSAPQIEGQVDLIRGTLDFAGRSFRINEGRLRFDGSSYANPTIALSASADIDGVSTIITISGKSFDPQIAFGSSPSLPKDEIMARILFGNSVNELSAIQVVQLAASLNSLRGGSGGLNPLGVLQSASGIDRLRILGADNTTGRGTALAVGQYITNDVYVEIVTDARGYTASQLEITLTPALSILSQISSFGGSNANLRYRKDY